MIKIKKTNMSEKTFLQVQTEGMERGFWSETSRSMFLISLESQYKTEIIREWGISDFIPNGDKVIVKWYKRFKPLSDMELSEKFGR